MIKWLKDISKLDSACGKYRITNIKSKYVDRRYLWVKIGADGYDYSCFCVNVSVDTLAEVMHEAELIQKTKKFKFMRIE